MHWAAWKRSHAFYHRLQWHLPTAARWKEITRETFLRPTPPSHFGGCGRDVKCIVGKELKLRYLFLPSNIIRKLQHIYMLFDLTPNTQTQCIRMHNYLQSFSNGYFGPEIVFSIPVNWLLIQCLTIQFGYLYIRSSLIINLYFSHKAIEVEFIYNEYHFTFHIFIIT